MSDFKYSVSIIIVNYNTSLLLKNCIESIYRHTKKIDFEIIVSDNDSKDDSVSMLKENFPEVKIIENGENLGFGRANNRGLKKALGKYIFYLNSDTILLNNAVKMFYDWWEGHSEESIGALGANLLNTQNEVIHSYGEILPLKKRLNKIFHCWLGISKDTVKYFFTKKLDTFTIEHHAQYTTGKVPYITGADLFVKNDEYAFYDEQYFMYNEEVDLQLNLHKNGKDSFLIEGPQIIHLEGGSTKKLPAKVKYLSSAGNIQLHKSYIQFYKKNFYNFFGIFLMKLFVTLIWLNPLIYSQCKKYIKEIWKI